MEIKTYPDPCLRIKTRKVEKFNGDTVKMLDDMANIMYANQGIGLAAPQVGLGLRALIIDTGDGLMSYINPVIEDESKERSKLEEGCLSLPGITVNVTRPEKITVRAQDAGGKFFLKTLNGLFAKAIQHEIDHLNGKLIIDYLDPVRYFLAVRSLKQAKKNKQNV
ncbi:MAG: peptide deformylase [Candidatus Omnitrophica bacterium]|nr:peptide deformylase [Candidatus Omnitrophota bacterium]